MNESAESLPTWLDGYRVLGHASAHVCLLLEKDVVAYWLIGRFRRRDLDALTRLAWDACEQRRYVAVSFTDRLDGYDSDLRSVVTDPGELAMRRATESIVVSKNPLERMIVQTMSLAGRAVGNPGGALSTASNLEDAVVRARQVLGELSHG